MHDATMLMRPPFHASNTIHDIFVSLTFIKRTFIPQFFQPTGDISTPNRWSTGLTGGPGDVL